MDKLKRRHKKKIILCEDWNIDLLTEDKHCKHLKCVLENYNFMSHILEPTRKKSCLDLIVSSLPNVSSKLHTLGLSDHETGQSITFPL